MPTARTGTRPGVIRGRDLRPPCRQSHNRHAPPPGLAFGEPDDRLQRASRFNHWRLWDTGSAFALRAAADRSPAKAPLSRGAFSPEVLQIRCPSANRGRRECRVRAAPAVSCARNCAFGAHEHTGQRKHSDIPCAMALRLTSCSPRWSGLVVTVTCEKSSTGLAPASRRQDHTTWPYASAFSSGAKNTPDAKASIASPAQRIVTIAKRPSCGPGWRD
jgi:hypothetical protein